jgi:hypothetical protein
MYIMYGPPDEIESYATRSQDKTLDVNLSSYPLEVWHYRFIEGIGEDVVIEFVDACRCGEYSMPMALVRDKDARFYPAKGSDGLLKDRPAPSPQPPFVGVAKTPKIKFKNLEEKVLSGLNFKTLPFDVTTDAVKATEVTSLVSITISFRSVDIKPAEKDGSGAAKVNIFGRVTTLTGWVAEIFEATSMADNVSGPASAPAAVAGSFVKTLALPNGRYQVAIAVQEANGDRWATWVQGVKVP